jgi:cytochrome c peroxidase
VQVGAAAGGARFLSTAAVANRGSYSSSTALIVAGLGVATAAQYCFADKKTTNWAEIRNDIADILENHEYDEGSYGPVFVRLAWHYAGTYCQLSKTGCSCGATMRFDPEAAHGANPGLDVDRAILEPIKKKHPEISYADLWSLASCVAIEEMGGPKIPWRAGRSDDADNKNCTPDGRLPDAARGEDHIRAIFYRMGFNDREIVALSGAHALGRCHTDRSGFEGPWTNAPTTFSNEYFVQLLEKTWVKRKWKGPEQYEDAETKQLMMLPTDIALIKDPAFKKYVDEYAANEELFFKDFARAYGKLQELGVSNLCPLKDGKTGGKPFWKIW